ncbi:hypothetical protein BREVNS_0845 [Brevinematales bacterium NS]|nr:radical SAM protein [Brevinematales bacterium]QJR21595.1 hypothetical protein BREVNS_0845 [Brevinematales bacterium NS]
MSIYVNVEDLCYESVFRSCQIEITGKCNFHCKHCRAAEDPCSHMEEAVFKKALEFADPQDDSFILVVSGGEPFLHPLLPKLLHIASVDFGIKRICVTTNGSCYEKNLLETIKETRPLHGCFLPLFGSGATPLKPRFFHLQGFICLFLFKGIVLFITLRNIFILFFVFYYFFETFAHSCKGLKTIMRRLQSKGFCFFG